MRRARRTSRRQAPPRRAPMCRAAADPRDYALGNSRGTGGLMKDLLQEGGVPPGEFSCTFDAMLGFTVLDQGVSQFAKGGEVLGSIAGPELMGIFGKDDVHHPMQLVLDFPMVAH